jgi:hypothetical protein
MAMLLGRKFHGVEEDGLRVLMHSANLGAIGAFATEL